MFCSPRGPQRRLVNFLDFPGFLCVYIQDLRVMSSIATVKRVTLSFLPIVVDRCTAYCTRICFFYGRSANAYVTKISSSRGIGLLVCIDFVVLMVVFNLNFVETVIHSPSVVYGARRARPASRVLS
jgi:hypothetical protein